MQGSTRNLELNRPIDRRQFPSWTEVIGTVEDVSDESIALKATYTIYITREELARWIHKLHKGSHVGILTQDDGSIRVRVLHGRPAGGQR